MSGDFPLNQEYYCVFWFPTIFHREKEHRNVSIFSKDISDDNKIFPLYLTIEEVPAKQYEDKYNIIFHLSKRKWKNFADVNNDKNHLIFQFTYKTHSRNGFVVYSYDRDTLRKDYRCFIGGNQIDALKESLADFLEKQGIKNPSDADVVDFGIDKLFLNCYHFAKNFYHEHEVHSESDGRLEAYFYTISKGGKRRNYITQEPNMKTKNHVVLNWFIDQFERQFIKYAKDVSFTYRNITSFLDDIRCLIERAPQKVRGGSDDEAAKLLAVIRWYKHVVGNMSLFFTKREYEHFVQDEYKKIKSGFVRNSVIKEVDDFICQQQEARLKYLHFHLNKLEVQCGDVLTEYTYCKTLVESKYNRCYDHKMLVTEREIQEILKSYQGNTDSIVLQKDNCRKKAFNIRNCVRYIEGIRQKCIIRENDLSYLIADKIVNISRENKQILDSSIRSGNISEMLAWISAALGGLSIGLALYKNTELVIFCELVNTIIFYASLCVFAVFIIKVIFLARKNLSK